jgi:DNA-binding transcriptional MerR regulator
VTEGNTARGARYKILSGFGEAMMPGAGERTYEIRQVAELTGLDTSRLRAWERRYKCVQPVRQPNGYRMYTAGQVALLRAFARLIARGEKIGKLVDRPMEEVILDAERIEAPHSAPPDMIEALLALDRARLEELVRAAIKERGLGGFAESVVVPLASTVGDLWALGILPVAAEHMASEVVVLALKDGIRDIRRPGPLVVAATLPGERHEWGFLSTLATLQERGWRVHYLGPDLPLAEIVMAAWKLRPRCVALSASDPSVVVANLAGLSDLPHRLPPGASAVIGGAGISTHSRRLTACGFGLGTDAQAMVVTGS